MKTTAELSDSEKQRLLRQKRHKELHWYALYVSPLHERQLLEAFTGVPDPYVRTRRGRQVRAVRFREQPGERGFGYGLLQLFGILRITNP